MLPQPDTTHLNDLNLAQAVERLQQGGLVAFPTETVYGLGADACNPQALARLYQAKGRPTSHPVIVHVGHITQATAWASTMPPVATALMEAFWPGPLTVIVPKANHVLDAVTGGLPGVGLRCPKHPIALALLQALAQASGGKPTGVAAPSANRFGAISPTQAHHVRAGLGPYLDPIRDGIMEGGACDVGIESTIVDCTGDVPKLLRPGSIGVDDLRAIVGPTLQVNNTVLSLDLSGQAPGTLVQHYAPKTPLWLFSATVLHAALSCTPTPLSGNRLGFLLMASADWASLDIHTSANLVMMPDCPKAYAQQLYHQLQTLDTKGLEALWLEAPPQSEPWRGVWDRLLRAGRWGNEATLNTLQQEALVNRG
jgi:L-threonylcarbamoyladenylate synthase